MFVNGIFQTYLIYGHRAFTSLSLTAMAYLKEKNTRNKTVLVRMCTKNYILSLALEYFIIFSHFHRKFLTENYTRMCSKNYIIFISKCILQYFPISIESFSHKNF